MNTMKRRLSYVSKGKFGNIIYRDEESEFELCYEFMSGKTLVSISIPTHESWIESTKKTPSERSEVLSYIAEQFIKDKAPNCKYIISENWIDIIEPDE